MSWLSFWLGFATCWYVSLTLLIVLLAWPSIRERWELRRAIRRLIRASSAFNAELHR